MREEMREALHDIRDMERLINRIVYKNANCQDLINLKIRSGACRRLKNVFWERCQSFCRAVPKSSMPSRIFMI